MNNHECGQFENTVGLSRRETLQRFGMGLGSLALASITGNESQAARGGVLKNLHHPVKAKRIIYMFQSGGPSQLDLFDHKPTLNQRHGEELPEEVRKGQRLTAMSGNQASLPLAGSPFEFTPHGDSGNVMSSVLPHTSKIADELCIVRSMYTEAINHGPAVTYLQTGSQFPGRPSMGAWLDYGLGTENENLPAFVVLVTKGKGGQPLLTRLWGSGFLPSKFQGVRFRSGADPVLYLSNPSGVDIDSRRMMLNRLRQLHELQLEKNADPVIENRIAQYEMAFKMQSSIPEVTDFSDEPEHTFESVSYTHLTLPTNREV